MSKLLEKFKKIKRDLIEEANEGIKAVKSSGIEEAGKTAASQAVGLKAKLMQEGGKFLKTYLKDNVTQENSTGATIGAFGEYVVKKTAKGIKQGLNSLQNYVESQANEYHKMDVIPELEAAKVLINEYAQDISEQGEEAINYKGIEIILNKTEKELSVNLKNKQKEVKIKYLLNGNDIVELNKDLEYITEDLIKKIDKLSDPDALRINKKTTFKIPQSKGETTYVVSFKKENGAYEVDYAPDNKILGIVNKKHGVILEYTLQKIILKEDPISEGSIQKTPKEE